MRKSNQPDQPISEEDAALRALIKEYVRQELADLLDERIDKRVDAALRRSVLALRPQVRNMEFK